MHEPVLAAIEELRGWWNRIMDVAERRNGTEFGDAIAWAVAQAETDTDRLAAIASSSDRSLEDFIVAAAPKATAVTEPTPADPVRPLVDIDTLPSWPVHALPPWVRDHVAATSTRLQVPVDLCAQLALGTLAAITMGKVTVVVWSCVETTDLYTYVAMHSGAGKSPAEKAIVGPLRVWETNRRDQTNEAHRIELAQWKVAQRKLKKDEEGAAIGSVTPTELANSVIAAAGERPAPYRLTVDDSTPERLVQLLGQHRRLALISTEAGLLDMVGGQMARNGTTNIDVYLKAWSGDTIVVDRVGRDSYIITKPTTSIVVTVQPSVLEAIGANPENRSNDTSPICFCAWAMMDTYSGCTSAPCAPKALPSR